MRPALVNVGPKTIKVQKKSAMVRRMDDMVEMLCERTKIDQS